MEKKKQLKTIWNSNLRGLIKDANTIDISKEEIVNIIKTGDQFTLIYYR